MKKLYVLPLAAVLFAACNESTAPDATSDLTPVFGQNPPAAPPPPVCAAGSPGCATWDNEANSIQASSEYGISANATTTSSPSGETFLGRFSTETVIFTLANADPGLVTISFKLYTIGAWGGQPRRAPAHLWQLATQCGNNAATRTDVFTASFSNRDGSIQSYPSAFGGRTTSDAFAGSSAINSLNYLSGGTNFYNVRTTDVADATYQMRYELTNSCPAGNFQIVMRGLNPTNTFDRSWGIDNLLITYL